MAQAKALTQKQKLANLEKTKKHLAEGKVVTINRDAVINIPVVGHFRDYLSETLNYIMASHSEEECMIAMQHIQENFKNLKEDAPYDPLLNSIWTLMTFISEINHQAAEQGHTFATEERFDESLSDMINQMQHTNDPVGLEKAYKENIKSYMSKVPGDINLSDNNKEEAYDGEKKDKTSNED